MVEVFRSTTALALAAAIALPNLAFADPFTDIILSLPEGQWAKVNNNTFKSVWPASSLRPDAQSQGSDSPNGTPTGVVFSWSSFAWDTKRNELILWGGGHHSYDGNEVYLWNSSTLNWERGSLPSDVHRPVPLKYPQAFEAKDGPFNAPISSHTYDNQEYLPVADRFVTFGGQSYNNGGPFVVTNPVPGESGYDTGPYFWDPAKANANEVGGTTGSGVNPTTPGGQMWQNRNVFAGRVPGEIDFVNGASDAVVADGKDVVYVEDGSGRLWKYTVNNVNDPSADTFVKVGVSNNVGGSLGVGSGAFDPTKQLFVRTAGHSFEYWDLSGSGIANAKTFTPTTIGGSFGPSGYYGLEYDPLRGHFVLWEGNGDVWYLDEPTCASCNWTLIEAALSTQTTPVPDDENPKIPGLEVNDGIAFDGINGKWKYIPTLDVFIGMNAETDCSVDAACDLGDVWIWKPYGWENNITVAVSGVSEPRSWMLLSLLLLPLGMHRRITGSS